MYIEIEAKVAIPSIQKHHKLVMYFDRIVCSRNLFMQIAPHQLQQK